VDFTKGDSYVEADDAKDVKCYLNVYSNTTAPEKTTDGFTPFILNRIDYNKGIFSNNATSTAKELHTRDIDGKLLNLAGDDVDLNRLYDVTVTIDYDTPDASLDPVEVEIKGTITN